MAKKERNNKDNQYIKYTGLAFQMGGTIFLGVWGGVKLDELLQHEFPILTLIFALLSVFASIYLAIKDFIKK
jgi:F0F1-type ATP synthase assembly protein I